MAGSFLGFMSLSIWKYVVCSQYVRIIIIIIIIRKCFTEQRNAERLNKQNKTKAVKIKLNTIKDRS